MELIKNIKHISLIAITFIALSFSVQVEASVRITDMCGLTTEPQEGTAPVNANGETYYIDTNNFEICNQDIGYKTLYLMYAETAISSEIGKKLFHTPYNPETDNNNIVEVSKNSGIGSAVKSLYESLNFLYITIFILVGPLFLTFLIVRNANGERENTSAKTWGVLVIVGALFMPMGSSNLLTNLVFNGAVIGMKLANYTLAGFLNNVAVQTVEPIINDSAILNKAEGNTETLLAGNLCEMQTRQAILNNSYNSNSMYTEKSWYESILGFSFFGNDDRIGLEKAHLCTNYFEVNDIEENKFHSISSQMVDYRSCDTTSLNYSPVKRIESQSGYENECFKVVYNWPSDRVNETILKSDNAVNELKAHNANLENNFGNQFNFDEMLLVYKRDLETIVSNYRSNTTDTDLQRQNKYIESLNVLASKIQQNFENNNYLTLNSELSNTEIGALLYTKHLAALNYLLGAYSKEDLTKNYVRRSERLNDTQVSHMADSGSLSRINIASHVVNSFTSSSPNLQKIYTDLNFTGIGIMNEKYYYEMAKNILRSQCITNIGDINSKDSILTYDLIKNNPRDVNSSVKLNFDCSVLEQKYGEEYPKLNHLIMDHNQSFTTEMKNKYRSFNIGSDQAIFEKKLENEEMINNYNYTVLDMVEEDKIILNSYYYVMNKAMAMNLAAKLKEYTDQSILIDTRKMGWAGFSAMLLNISQSQLNSTSYINDLNSTFITSAYSENTDKGMSFINYDAFYDANKNEYNDNENARRISVVDGARLNLLLKTSQSSREIDFTSDTAKERGMTEKFVSWFIEAMFETPFNYLKVGTGLMERNETGRNDQSIADALDRCAITQDCISKNGHPINGVIMFGQASVSNSINIILISNVVSFMSNNMESVKLPPIPALTAVMSVLKIILALADVFFSLIIPLVYVIAFAGVMLGYFMPFMHYLITMGLMVGWLVGIFVRTNALSILILVNCILKVQGKDINGFKFGEIWKITGSVILFPLFLVIGLILSWVLMNVMIYYINSTASVLFNIFNPTNPITAFAFTLINFISFLILFWIVIKFCLKPITEVNKIFSRYLNIDTDDSSAFVQSVGIESLMVAGKAVGALRTVGAMKGRSSQSNLDKITDNAGQAKESTGKIIDSLRERIGNKTKIQSN